MISMSFMLTVCEDAKVMSYSDNVGEEIKIKGRLQDIFPTLVQYVFWDTEKRSKCLEFKNSGKGCMLNFKKSNKKIEQLKC